MMQPALKYRFVMRLMLIIIAFSLLDTAVCTEPVLDCAIEKSAVEHFPENTSSETRDIQHSDLEQDEVFLQSFAALISPNESIGWLFNYANRYTYHPSPQHGQPPEYT